MIKWTQLKSSLSDEPAYRHLAVFLKGQISLGHLQDGDRLPPIRDLAKQSGVGLNTVRHAMDLLVKEKIIHQTRGKGTFVADDASQQIVGHASAGKVFRLDGIRVMILGPFSFLRCGDPRPFENLECQIKALGGTTRFQTEDAYHPLPSKRWDQISQEVDAVVWFGMNGLNDTVTDARIAQRLKALNLPVVTAYSRYERLFDGVDVNWEQGMWQAVEYLVQRGDSRIAFLGLRHASNSTQRFPWVASRGEMFLTACQYFGLEVDESDQWFVDIPQIKVTDHTPDVLRQAGRQLGKQLLQSTRPYSAMIGANDLLALGVCDALTQGDVRMPEDVAMIGFDDSAEAMVDELTTIAPQWKNDARAAAKLLARIIAEPQTDAMQFILSAPRLVVRHSTAGRSCGLEKVSRTEPLPA